MTFLSEQSFDEDGNIKTFIKKGHTAESADVQADGSVKAQVRVKFEYGNLTAEDITPIGNLCGAECLVLTHGDIFLGMSTPPLNHVAEECRFAHRVGMAAANIGERSKRGTGNTIVCHPSTRDQVDAMFDKMKIVQKYDEATDDMQDVEVPYFPNGPLTVFEHDLAPDDSVLVIYRGESDEDQPLIYVEGHGLVTNSKVVAVEHYGKFVRIP
jgi:hypothetical protein